MPWYVCLFRYLFPATARNALLQAAWISARLIVETLQDRVTGAIRDEQPWALRLAFQRLHDCALCVFHAIEERAREIAGLPRRRLGEADIRQSELTTRDISPYRLVRRARDILRLIHRFERLAQRRALRLKRLLAAEPETVTALTFAALVLLSLAADSTPAPAPPIGAAHARFSAAPIRAPP